MKIQYHSIIITGRPSSLLAATFPPQKLLQEFLLVAHKIICFSIEYGTHIDSNPEQRAAQSPSVELSTRLENK
jgi:hypothetical protein